MEAHIQELIAMGYTREEAERIYREGVVDPEVQRAANKRAYDFAEDQFGTQIANDLRFLNVDPYIKNVNEEADKGNEDYSNPVDSQRGTAVPSYMNPDYDVEFIPGGGVTEEVIPMPEGGYEGTSETELKPNHPAYTPSNTTHGVADGIDAEAYKRIEDYRATGMTDDEIRQYDTSVAHLLPAGNNTSPSQPQNTYVTGDWQEPTPPVEPVDEKTAYQQDLLQAQTDASATMSDPQGAYSYQYKNYEPMGTGNRIFQSMLTYGLAYLATGGDAEKGLTAALEFNNVRSDREHRYGQVQYLESRGYNPKDIDEWVKSGDPKALVKNKTTWQSAGGGRIYNTATGETKELEKGKKIDKTVDLGDRVEVYYTDGTSEVRSKGMTPSQANKAGGGTGARVIKTKVDLGDRVRVYYTDGTFEDIAKGDTTAQQIKKEEANKQRTQQQADLARTTGELNTLVDNPVPVTLANWTGGIGNPAIGADNLSKLDADTRSLYESAVRINTMQENMGIAEAKAMGASGINTVSEAERFSRSMPRVDFSSPTNLQKSAKRIRDYINRWNAQYDGGASTTTTPAPTQTTAPAPKVSSANVAGGGKQASDAPTVVSTAQDPKTGKWYAKYSDGKVRAL